MARALAFHPEALEEFEAAALRYAAIRPALGEAFIDRVEAATTRAVHSPMTGAPLGSLRRVFVKRFPYFVLYAVEESRIVVLAVAHFRQRPGYWRRRSQR
ncbi:MAG TPA: type II toxin-antitoxin system RelE/ParE family toxin [Gemmatimonadaceae bacterium]|nr:type II toxin-antitoxin system RelE/ParE family toxin [Gemmatimonadaceae bacterium]